jgi:Protein of unknown function (DUF3800)
MFTAPRAWRIRMRITFDECGYTGEHLLDKEQAVFALASTSLDDGDCGDLLHRFSGRTQGEFKYTKLKKARRNEPLILSLLRDSRISQDTCKVFAIHKPFMLVTKLVDNICEPEAREFGLDLYEGRAGLALANLISSTFPTFLGRTRYNRFLQAFSELSRNRGSKPIERFAAESEAIYQHLQRKFSPAAETFSPVVLACRKGLRFLAHTTAADFDHDPIIPSYHTLANEWSKQTSGRFEILADESKVLAHERGRLLKFSDPNLKEVELKLYANTAIFPLRISDIITARSEAHHSIQLADLLSGAVFQALNERAQRQKPDEFEEALFEVLADKQLFLGMWPSAGVTPEEVEGVGEYDGSVVDYSMKILSDDKSVLKQRPTIP